MEQSKEMVEKVARAIAVDVYHRCGLETVTSQNPDAFWRDYLNYAKAALSIIQPKEAGDLVELIARTIFQTDPDGPLGIFDELSADFRKSYERQAQAVLSVLPDNTQALAELDTKLMNEAARCEELKAVKDLYASDLENALARVEKLEFKMADYMDIVDGKDRRIAELEAKPVQGDVPIAYMRDLDYSGSYHICAKGDTGWFPVYAALPAQSSEAKPAVPETVDGGEFIKEAFSYMRKDKPAVPVVCEDEAVQVMVKAYHKEREFKDRIASTDGMRDAYRALLAQGQSQPGALTEYEIVKIVGEYIAKEKLATNLEAHHVRLVHNALAGAGALKGMPASIPAPHTYVDDTNVAKMREPTKEEMLDAWKEFKSTKLFPVLAAHLERGDVLGSEGTMWGLFYNGYLAASKHIYTKEQFPIYVVPGCIQTGE